MNVEQSSPYSIQQKVAQDTSSAAAAVTQPLFHQGPMTAPVLNTIIPGFTNVSHSTSLAPRPGNCLWDDNNEQVAKLKVFLTYAPKTAPPMQHGETRVYHLPSITTPGANGDTITCTMWNGHHLITGTDIVRIIQFRFACLGIPVQKPKKLEEGVFSDLRNLKPGVDALLEGPKSELLKFLYDREAIRTQKKQKVFFWYKVQHDILFGYALEREMRRIGGLGLGVMFLGQMQQQLAAAQQQTGQATQIVETLSNNMNLAPGLGVYSQQPTLPFKPQSGLINAASSTALIGTRIADIDPLLFPIQDQRSVRSHAHKMQINLNQLQPNNSNISTSLDSTSNSPSLMIPFSSTNENILPTDELLGINLDEFCMTL